VEKFLKAYLTGEKLRFERIHNLWSLSKLLKKDKKLVSFEEKLKLLDAYYIESRYPLDIKSYSQKECTEVLKMTREITQFIFLRIEAL
jgi:HEPN domain-containing protein